MTVSENYADRDGVLWLDGELVPWREARLHVLTHGLHYGTCVFEGLRVYDGRIFKLREHTERLLHSGRELGLTIPFTTPQLESAARQVVAEMGIGDGYLRPVAWRGSDTMGMTARQGRVHTAIAVWEWPHIFQAGAAETGITLLPSRWRRPGPASAPVTAKASGIYMIGVLAREEAEHAGFDDALLLGPDGQVAEATGANIFLVIDGALHTPVPDCFLDGITRQTVVDCAKQRGIAVYERAIPPAELARADEVFLTGTAYEVQPVRAVGDRTFPVGEVTRGLQAAFAELVRLGTARPEAGGGGR